MSTSEFEEVLRKITPFAGHIYLHVMGEPLMHPDFPGILKICETRKIKVNIATNGVLIKKHGDSIISSGAVRQVNFSIHCLDVQREKELPASYLADILEFIDEGRQKTQIYFALRLWNMKADSEVSSEMVRRIGEFFSMSGQVEVADCLPMGRDFYSKEGGHSCPPRRGLENPRSVEEKERQCDYKIMNRCFKGRKGLELAPNVFLNFAEEFGWPDIHGKTFPEGKIFCRGLRDHCAILADGTVVPCCLDKDGAVPLGNIFESDGKFCGCRVVRLGQGEEISSPGRRTLHQIIGSDRAEKIIKGFSEGRAVEQLCKTCGFRRRFA